MGPPRTYRGRDRWRPANARTHLLLVELGAIRALCRSFGFHLLTIHAERVDCARCLATMRKRGLLGEIPEEPGRPG